MANQIPHRRILPACLTFITITILLLSPAVAPARDVAIRAFNVVVKANAYLYLQIGTEGAIIDQISFRVAALPGAGPVRGESTGIYPVPVVGDGLLSAAGTVTLIADASQPMTNGLGNQIPYSQISWQGSGDVPSGQFAGSATQIIMQQSAHKGRLKLNGAMAFFYGNTQFFPAGIYSGRVTYTLSAP
jgi:hypothetical protein